MAPTAVSTSKSMFLILQNVLLSVFEPLKHNNTDLNMENKTLALTGHEIVLE
jgi:hypothetical protein